MIKAVIRWAAGLGHPAASLCALKRCRWPICLVCLLSCRRPKQIMHIENLTWVATKQRLSLFAWKRCFGLRWLKISISFFWRLLKGFLSGVRRIVRWWDPQQVLESKKREASLRIHNFMTQNIEKSTASSSDISLNTLRSSQLKCIDVTINAATEANCRKVKAILSNPRTGKHMEPWKHSTEVAFSCGRMHDLHRSSGIFSSSPVLVIWSQYHLPPWHLH